MNQNVARPPRGPVQAQIINNDPAAKGQAVIFTNAANDLTLSIENSGAGATAWSLTGGSSVPDQASFDPLQGQSPSSSVFYLGWPGSATITFDPGELTAPAGWNIKLFTTGPHAPYLGFAPSANIDVQPDKSIEFVMKGVTALAGQPPSPTLSLDGYFVVTSEPLSIVGTVFQTQMHAKPGPGKQPFDLLVQFINVSTDPNSVVYLTPPGEPTIHTDLAVLVQNLSSDALIPAGSKATGNEQIAITYTVGDDDMDGVLATLADVKQFPAPHFNAAGVRDWSGNKGPDGVTFLVTPKLSANPQILAANGETGDQVVILLNDLFSHNTVQPGSAQMTVAVCGFNDYNDHAFLLAITKNLPPGILRFEVDKSTILQGDTIELSWFIAGVPGDSVQLDGLPQGSLIGEQVLFEEPGLKIQITANTKLCLSTTAPNVDRKRQEIQRDVTVLVPKITSFDVETVPTDFVPEYNLSWAAEHFSTITLNGRSMDPKVTHLDNWGAGQSSFVLTVSNEFGFSDSWSWPD